MIARRLVIEEVDGNDGAVMARGDERGLIGKAQVLPQSEEDGSSHSAPYVPR
jgi:hypothetical protein